MNHCPIHQQDFEEVCPECMGEAAAECSTVVDLGGLTLGPAVFKRIDVNGETVFDANDPRTWDGGDPRENIKECMETLEVKQVSQEIDCEAYSKLILTTGSKAFEIGRQFRHTFFPEPRPEHAPWLKSLPQFKKFVIPSSRNYGKSWLYEFWRESNVLDDHRRGLTRSDLWAKYPKFTKAQIRKIVRGR